MRAPQNLGRWTANFIALVILAGAFGALPAGSADANRAALVVVHGNGQVNKICVTFNESQISGLDLLTRAGLDLNVDASNPTGVAVCRLDKEGCTFPGQACFCQCQGTPCIYWSYWRLTNGAWKYSSLGASSTIVHNGDVDGWNWAVGNFTTAATPPTVTFEQVCPLPTATSTSTSTSTATATNVLSTNTPLPSTATAQSSTSTPLPRTQTPSVTPQRLPSSTATRVIAIARTATQQLPTLIARAINTDTPQPSLEFARIAAATETRAPEPDSENATQDSGGASLSRIQILGLAVITLFSFGMVGIGALVIAGLAWRAVRRSK